MLVRAQRTQRATQRAIRPGVKRISLRRARRPPVSRTAPTRFSHGAHPKRCICIQV